MIALEWSDVDLVKRQLCVRQSDWNGQVGRRRKVDGCGTCRSRDGWPRRSCEHRHLRSKRVLCQDDG